MTPTAPGQAMTYETYLREQGFEQGIEQGGRIVLLRQLRLRFSDVPADVLRRVEAAGVEQIGC